MFYFLLAGLIQTMSGDLPFNNEAAKYLWLLLSLTILSTLKPVLSLVLVGDALSFSLACDTAIALGVMWVVKMVAYVTVYFPMKQGEFNPKVHDENACAMEDEKEPV